MQPIAGIPVIDAALAAALGLAGLVTLASRGRGGRFRTLPGWLGFWAVFGGMLVGLSRAPAWASFPVLGLAMFVGLRTYFFVAPVRARDRYAILGAYLSIPLALYPGFVGAHDTFLATVPIVLFLCLPVLLSVGASPQGALDAMGRILLGVLLFVFCASHLGLVGGPNAAGRPELFGVFVIAADLSQRLAGRQRPGWFRPALVVGASALAVAAVGYVLGPSCGLGKQDAARAGFLVALAVAMGALVTQAVVRDLALAGSPTGRGALLDRAIPAVYAAPVFFHYLNHFA